MNPSPQSSITTTSTTPSNYSQQVQTILQTAAAHRHQQQRSSHDVVPIKLVYKLLCRHCQHMVCARGMKAILLADVKVELYSTDTPSSLIHLMDKDYSTRTCQCRIRDVACMECGNIIGYHVVSPCKQCLTACNNGHFWMFHSDACQPIERKDASGKELMVWNNIPRADRDIDFLMGRHVPMDWISSQVKHFYTCSPPSPKVSLPPMVTVEPLAPVVPIQCESCVLPCSSHDRIPAHLNIDQTRSLHNTVTPYSLHLIVFTGRSDWPGHIEDEELTGALMDCLDRRRKSPQQQQGRSSQNTFHLYGITNNEQQQQQQRDQEMKQYRVLVTNSSLPSQYSSKGLDILVLPDNKIIANITRKRIEGFVDLIYGQSSSDFDIHPSPWSNLILVCGHRRKDKRCGTIGPMLQQAFDQALEQHSMENQCQVMLVSHLGGHAFAGNVVLYTHQGLRSIWYGRITPCHCPNIVRYSVCKDHVLQEFVRGILQAGSDKGNKPYVSLSLEW